jgi:hypothetical protein
MKGTFSPRENVTVLEGAATKYQIPPDETCLETSISYI